MNKLFKLSSVIACSSILIACGGDGGTEHSILSSESIHGSASKGIIANGEVKVWKILSSGKRSSASFAKLETSEIGEFSGSLDISKDEMLYFEVRGRDDGSSRMYCDLGSCGTATDPELDENDNGIVDFGEWTPIDNQIYVSAYVSYEGSKTPVRINLLTHMVSQSFGNVAPSVSELEDAYGQLQDRLDLTSLPNELTPLLVSEEDFMNTDQLMDNMVVQGMMMSVAASGASLSEAIDTITSLYVDDPELESEEISDANITLHTMVLTENLLRTVSSEVLPASERAEIINELLEQYEDAADSENKLSLQDFPKLPPNLM